MKSTDQKNWRISAKGFATKRVEAKALFYALFILTVLTIISGLFITSASLNKDIQDRFIIKEKLINNAHSGIAYLRAQSGWEQEGTIVNLFGNSGDSVYLEKKAWAWFSIGIAQAFQTIDTKKEQAEQVVLLGCKSEDYFDAGLYLCDQNKALALCGKTKIQGDAYLPKAGVKRGYINGISYQNDRLIYGDQKRSKRQLAMPDEKIKDWISRQFNERKLIVPLANDSMIQAFTAPLLRVHQERILLRNKYLQGHLIISADSIIEIGDDMYLEDVILIAPKIRIGKNTRGNFQAFAFSQIEVEAETKLDYPTVLCLITDTKYEENPKIIIGKSAHIFGHLILWRADAKAKPLVEIAQEAIIEGWAFLEATVALSGKIKGHLSCSNFVYKTASSIYDNHLFNASILRDELNPNFCGGYLQKDAKLNARVKWLN